MAVNCYRVQNSQQIVNIGVCVAIAFCFVDNAAAARHVDAVVHDDFLELLDDLGTAVAHRRCHLHTTTQTRAVVRIQDELILQILRPFSTHRLCDPQTSV